MSWEFVVALTSQFLSRARGDSQIHSAVILEAKEIDGIQRYYVHYDGFNKRLGPSCVAFVFVFCCVVLCLGYWWSLVGKQQTRDQIDMPCLHLPSPTPHPPPPLPALPADTWVGRDDIDPTHVIEMPEADLSQIKKTASRRERKTNDKGNSKVCLVCFFHRVLSFGGGKGGGREAMVPAPSKVLVSGVVSSVPSHS